MYSFLSAWAFALSAGAIYTAFLNFSGEGYWQGFGIGLGIGFWFAGLWLGRNATNKEDEYKGAILDKLNKIVTLLEKEDK